MVICDCCGKKFYITHGKGSYLYKRIRKIKTYEGKVSRIIKYYCGYNCWIQGEDNK